MCGAGNCGKIWAATGKMEFMALNEEYTNIPTITSITLSVYPSVYQVQ
jgi:hypothetical protein